MKNIPNRLFIPETEPLLVGGHNNREWPLGQLAETPDGRLFRYALNGGVIMVAHKLYQSVVTSANFDTLAIGTNAAVGDKTLALTGLGDAVAEDYFAFGQAVIEETLGTAYPIKSHPADGTGSTATTLTFQDGVTIQKALTAGSETVNIILSPYKSIIITPGTGQQTALVVGIPLVVTGLANYCWIQTHGLVNVLADSGTGWTAGQAVRPSTEDAGAVEFLDASDNEADSGIIGKCPYAGVDTTFAPIFLTLE